MIANSNTKEDQAIKKKIVNNLSTEIKKITTLDTSLQNSRENIKTNGGYL